MIRPSSGLKSLLAAGHFPQSVIRTLCFNRKLVVLVDVSTTRYPGSHTA